VDDEAERAVLNQIADLVVDLAAPPPPAVFSVAAPAAPGGVGVAVDATATSPRGKVGHPGPETGVDADSIRSPSFHDADDSASAADDSPDAAADAGAGASIPDAGGEQAVSGASKSQGVSTAHNAEGSASGGGPASGREGSKRCHRSST